MSVISLSKISQNVIPEFVDTALMPTAPAVMRWVLGGSTFLILRRADDLVAQYLPMLRTAGLVNEQNQLDIELTKGFLFSAFDKSPTLHLFGYNFNRNDGEMLINIMEKFKDV